MGERVVFDPERFARSQARPVIPLNYGSTENWLTRKFHACLVALRPRRDGLARWLDATVKQLGGLRQVGFAGGLGLVLGAFGCAIDRFDPTTGGLMFVGGVLIGLSIRLRAFRPR